MKAVAIKELKNGLSRYLREVIAGETILVTDRGKVVAELRRPTADLRAVASDRALEPLANEGLLRLGLPQDRRAYRKTRIASRRQSQSLLDAERGDR